MTGRQGHIIADDFPRAIGKFHGQVPGGTVPTISEAVLHLQEVTSVGETNRLNLLGVIACPLS